MAENLCEAMARLEIECTERSGILAKFSRKRSRDSDMPTFVRTNCHERRENRMRQSCVRCAEPLRKHGRQQLADGAIERSDTREMDHCVTAFQAHEETLHAGAQTEPLPIDCAYSAGEADLYPRHGTTMEWDTAAGHAVVVAAGGSVTRLDGSPLHYGKPGFENPHFVARGLG